MAKISLALTADEIWGGSHQYVVVLARELTERGHEVTVLGGHNKRVAGSVKAGGSRFIEIPSLIRSVSPSKDLAAYRSLRSHFANDAPDLVVSNSSKAGALCRVAGRSASVSYTHLTLPTIYSV